jgi:hypothetical protein
VGESKDSKFTVGYKKPPRRTQFKAGQSGNPVGRPRKKGPSLAEAIADELNTSIHIVVGDKARTVSKSQAIAIRHVNKAVTGDVKALALIIKAVNPSDSEQGDALSPVLDALRTIHAKHEAVARDETRTSQDRGSAAAGPRKNEPDDPA